MSYTGSTSRSVEIQLVQQDVMRHSMEDNDTIPIESKAQLIEYLEAGCKPPAMYRLGTEQEKFVYRSKDFSPDSLLRHWAIKAYLYGTDTTTRWP